MPAPAITPPATASTAPPEPYEQDAEHALRFYHPTIHGLGVEVTQDLDRPADISVALMLRSFNLHSTTDGGHTVIGDPRDPDAIRALGEMLIAFADEAERRGLLAPCRAALLARTGKAGT